MLVVVACFNVLMWLMPHTKDNSVYKHVFQWVVLLSGGSRLCRNVKSLWSCLVATAVKVFRILEQRAGSECKSVGKQSI